MLIIKRINIKFKELAFSALYIKKINTRAHFVWNIKFHKSVGKKITSMYVSSANWIYFITLSFFKMGQQRLKNPLKKLSVVYIEIYREKKLTYFWRTLYIYVHVYISIFSLSTWTFIKKNKFILGFTILVILLFMNEFLLK